MFSKNERGGAGKGVPSIIGANLTVNGNLDGEAVIQVEGAVEGDVHCDDLTVGREAKVRGQIECDSVRVHGTVIGEIRGRCVSLTASARVIGDIVHEELSIEAGAYVEGQLLRRDAQQSRLNLVVNDEI
jgi:cytoskeletal protein CcmA (bactofilin family)